MSPRKKSVSKAGLFLLVNVVVFFFLIVAFGREYVGNIQVEREIQQLEAEKSRLEQDKLNTLNLIEDLSSEEYLEREARTKHGLAEPGETLVVIQDPDENITGIDASLFEDEAPPVPNAKRWFYYFFDREAYSDLKTL